MYTDFFLIFEFEDKKKIKILSIIKSNWINLIPENFQNVQNEFENRLYYCFSNKR
jgi:hypothetical protein